MKNLLPLSLICLLCAVSVASAATVFNENFDSYTAGAQLPVGLSSGGFKWASAAAVNRTTAFEDVTTDTNNYFALGTSNQYLRLAILNGATTSDVKPAATINDVTVGTIGQVSLNFYDPSNVDFTGRGFLLRVGTGNSNGTTAFGLYFRNGALYYGTGSSVNLSASSIATYTLDTLYSLSIVYNNTNGSYTYGSQTLNSGTMDIWLNGVLAASGVASTGNVTLGTSLDNLNFTVNGSTLMLDELLVDNITMSDTIAVPEPRGLALAMTAGMAVMGWQRLRKKSVRQ